MGPAESFTVASIRTRAAPWLRGRRSEVIRQFDVKVKARRDSVLLETEATSNRDHRELEALTVISPPSNRFSKKVVRPHGSRHNVAGPVAAFRFVVLSRQNHIPTLNFGRMYMFDVECDLGPCSWAPLRIRPPGREVIRPRFTSSAAEFADAIPKLVGLCRLLEDIWLHARIFHLQKSTCIGGCL